MRAHAVISSTGSPKKCSNWTKTLKKQEILYALPNKSELKSSYRAYIWSKTPQTWKYPNLKFFKLTKPQICWIWSFGLKNVWSGNKRIKVTDISRLALYQAPRSASIFRLNLENQIDFLEIFLLFAFSIIWSRYCFYSF